MGDSTGGQGSSFDPFSSATLNVYLLNYTNAGGLATFEMYTQYVEMAMRMFGGYMNYNFAPVTKQLTIMRDPKASGEQVLLGHTILSQKLYYYKTLLLNNGLETLRMLEPK